MWTNLCLTSARAGCTLYVACACFVAALVPRVAAADADRRGEQIYRQKCASCHGAAGEGTDEHYAAPLVGDRSVTALARLIAKTMPEDAPGECVGEDAEKVAAYVYDAFYSKAAQVRNKIQLPRIELSRLTVRQYRNAVADLVGSFRTATPWGPERGLKAEYTRARRRGGNGSGSVKRIDPEVQFDFGPTSPIPEQNALRDVAKTWERMPLLWVPLSWLRPFSQEFRVNWRGSLLAPDTGDYEFRIKTENGVRLWVNDMARPLIDAGVKSGNDTEYRGSIFLLGGRVYPLRVELSRSKGETTSSIRLEWKIPRRAFEVVPQRNLSPSQSPEMFVLKAPFPPDDRSIGYERGASISKAWDQATTDAAIEVAGYILGHLRELAGVSSDAADREAKLREFCRRFAERAFRRPLSDEQKAFFVDRRFKDTLDLDLPVKRVVILVLKAPRFLYREIGSGRPDGYDVASRISFGLWDSLPDQALLDAAAAGQLATREQVIGQAQRMVLDRRARSKLRDFFVQWLKVDQVPELVKDSRAFPQFDEAIVSDLRTSLDLFLDEVIESESADFRQLFDANHLYMNGRLARFYGIKLAPNAPFQKVFTESHERAGVLSHPYMMASLSYTASSSPIHRGVFLARSILGRVLRPPPEAIAPLVADLHPDLTTRQRVVLQTKPEPCQSCHGMINPLGFTLEHFDAVGRFRGEEKGRPVEATGSYETRTGEFVKFDGARDLATFLVESEETQSAFIRQLFHCLVKQPIRAFGSHELPDLLRFFAAREFNIRKLMIEIMATSALTPRGVKL